MAGLVAGEHVLAVEQGGGDDVELPALNRYAPAVVPVMNAAEAAAVEMVVAAAEAAGGGQVAEEEDDEDFNPFGGMQQLADMTGLLERVFSRGFAEDADVIRFFMTNSSAYTFVDDGLKPSMHAGDNCTVLHRVLVSRFHYDQQVGFLESAVELPAERQFNKDNRKNKILVRATPTSLLERRAKTRGRADEGKLLKCNVCGGATRFFHLLRRINLCPGCVDGDAVCEDYVLIPAEKAMNMFLVPKSVLSTVLSLRVWRTNAWGKQSMRVLLMKDVRKLAEMHWKGELTKKLKVWQKKTPKANASPAAVEAHQGKKPDGPDKWKAHLSAAAAAKNAQAQKTYDEKTAQGKKPRDPPRKYGDLVEYAPLENGLALVDFDPDKVTYLAVGEAAPPPPPFGRSFWAKVGKAPDQDVAAVSANTRAAKGGAEHEREAEDALIEAGSYRRLWIANHPKMVPVGDEVKRLKKKRDNLKQKVKNESQAH